MPATAPTTAGTQDRYGTQTISVLAIAAMLRLLVVADVARKYPPRWLFARGMEMGLLAQSLLAGRGLASPFGPQTGPTAFIAPGYPLLTAGVFRMFGSFSFASMLAVMLLHTAAALVTVWLVMQVARQLGGLAAGWAAGLTWALGLPLLWVPTIFWDTSFAIATVTAMLAAVLRLAGEAQGRHWILLGAATALAGLLNPALLPVMGCMLLWLAWQRRAAAGILLAALVFALVFAVWPIRNARVFHAFIPLRTTVGYEMWMGNRPGATGFLEEDLFPSFNVAELNDYRARGELGYTAHKAELARQYIHGEPQVFARMTAMRVWRFWSGTGSKGGSPIFAVYATLTTAFGMAGLWLLVRRRRYALAVLSALPVLVFPLPYYITHAEFRYRLVIDPVMTILTGYALGEWRRQGAAARAAETRSDVRLEAGEALHA